VLLSLLLGGCAAMGAGRLADQLSLAMLNQSDPEIVRAGAPAYLLLIDSLIADSPHDETLLLTGARLYGAYASGLVQDAERRRGLSDRALTYARQAVCATGGGLCDALDLPYNEFTAAADRTGAADLHLLYGYASTQLGWIEARSGDWNAVAELPRVQYLLERVVRLDPRYEQGRAQLYLGILLSLRPASLGGKPEQARRHFEQAIAISAGRDLMVKVEFARRYARLVFDQELHDRLLNEVLQAEPAQPGLTLGNVIAQAEARQLLMDDYF
jgi:tetratricopeptide (TPR) repeat protein